MTFLLRLGEINLIGVRIQSQSGCSGKSRTFVGSEIVSWHFVIVGFRHVAALPLSLRKGSAYPGTSLVIEAMPGRRHSRKNLLWLTGGKAAQKELAQKARSRRFATREFLRDPENDEVVKRS